MSRRLKRNSIILAAILSVIFIICDIFMYVTVSNANSTLIYDRANINNLPYNEAALVLGAGEKTNIFGFKNHYFYHRMEAAAELYKAGKVKVLILSGWKNEKYDEAFEMKKEILTLGVPENALVIDNYGKRTIDSIKGISKNFGYSSFTIVSQKFHNERALYLAASFGLTAVAYNAKDVDGFSSFLNSIREFIARFRMFLDLYVWS